MKKYKQLTAAVLLSCATMLAPFHAEAAHEAVYKFSDDGKTMSVYIDDMTKPFINFMVYNASTTGDSIEYRDFFTAGNGMQIVHLGTNNVPKGFQTLVDDIRRDISCTSSNIQSDFKLHVTLGRITEPEASIDDVGFLIDEIDFMPFTLTLNEVEYRVFRGKSIYKSTLK